MAAFLSTLSLRRATLETLYLSLMPAISIHALLAESDSWLRGMIPLCLYFYPRSPCGERRVHYDNYNLHCVISIHALLAESDNARHGPAAFAAISIHALLAESDQSQTLVLLAQQLFLSTLSLRRATC